MGSGGVGLGKWTYDQRELFYTLLVKQYSIKRAAEMVCEEFEEERDDEGFLTADAAHEYTYANILHHTKTDACKEALVLARDKLALSLRNASFADPARRLSFAIEQAERLADLMREDNVSATDHKRLGDEMRKWNDEIRTEEAFLSALNPESLEDNAHVMSAVVDDDDVPDHVRDAARSLTAVK